jgi:hypothetical protein
MFSISDLGIGYAHEKYEVSVFPSDAFMLIVKTIDNLHK